MRGQTLTTLQGFAASARLIRARGRKDGIACYPAKGCAEFLGPKFENWISGQTFLLHRGRSYIYAFDVERWFAVLRGERIAWD